MWQGVQIYRWCAMSGSFTRCLPHKATLDTGQVRPRIASESPQGFAYEVREISPKADMFEVVRAAHLP